MKQTAVEWLILQIEEKNNGTSNGKLYKEIYDQAKEMEKQQQGYSEEDMKSFADWCRNGLLNTEYSVDRLNEHLEQWKQYNK